MKAFEPQQVFENARFSKSHESSISAKLTVFAVRLATIGVASVLQEWVSTGRVILRPPPSSTSATTPKVYSRPPVSPGHRMFLYSNWPKAASTTAIAADAPWTMTCFRFSKSSFL